MIAVVVVIIGAGVLLVPATNAIDVAMAATTDHHQHHQPIRKMLPKRQIMSTVLPRILLFARLAARLCRRHPIM
jgi:hypothetical protein